MCWDFFLLLLWEQQIILLCTKLMSEGIECQKFGPHNILFPCQCLPELFGRNKKKQQVTLNKMCCILIKGKYKHINFASKLLNYSRDKIWLKTLFYSNVFKRASPLAKCYTLLFLQLSCPICKVTPTYFSFVSNTNFLVSSNKKKN